MTAAFFALLSAAGSVLLEWYCPLQGWKIEGDLWRHPRKYVLPAIMLLLAGLEYVLTKTQRRIRLLSVSVLLRVCLGIIIVPKVRATLRPHLTILRFPYGFRHRFRVGNQPRIIFSASSWVPIGQPFSALNFRLKAMMSSIVASGAVKVPFW